MRMRTPLVAATAATLGLGLALVPAGSASAKPDTDCMRAGMKVLKDAGLFSSVAKDGLPVTTALAVGVMPREGTDASSLPDSLPLSVVLADHRAGANSLFVYPWCG